MTNPWGAPVLQLEECASTMDEIRRFEREGAPHGFVVSSGFQTAGRGRRAERSWTGERGANLLFSLLLRYGGALPPVFTLKMGLAIARAIERCFPALDGTTAIKWPNDIILNGKKVCGILTESDGANIFAGAGINVLQRDFGGIETATSIALETGCAEDGGIERLLETILMELKRELDAGSADWRERLEAKLFRRGKTARFAAGAADCGAVIEGTLRGVAPSGALLIETRGGTREWHSGEITFV